MIPTKTNIREKNTWRIDDPVPEGGEGRSRETKRKEHPRDQARLSLRGLLLIIFHA